MSICVSPGATTRRGVHAVFFFFNFFPFLFFFSLLLFSFPLWQGIQHPSDDSFCTICTLNRSTVLFFTAAPPFSRFLWITRFLWGKWKKVHDSDPILFSILHMCTNFHNDRPNNKDFKIICHFWEVRTPPNSPPSPPLHTSHSSNIPQQRPQHVDTSF